MKHINKKQHDLFGKPYRKRKDIPVVEREYASGWKPRKGNFGVLDVENDCRTIRGVLIARADDCFEYGARDRLVARMKDFMRMVLNGSVDGTQRELEGFVTQAFQEMLLAFFPEEFLEESEAAATIKGIVPRAGQGMERVNYTHIAKLAAKLTQKVYAVAPTAE